MNADDLPDPFVPPDHDVSMLSDFRLNVDRLLASELVAVGTAEECWAAFMLWCRAWKQIPGGSLPNDERTLAGFSGAGSRWKRIRDVAMHGFVLCSDGRYYHRFLCEEVKRAYKSHVANATRRDADRKRLADWRAKRAGNDHETPNETRFVAEEPEPEPEPKKEDSDANASGAEAPDPDPVKAIWDRGVKILGQSSRGLIGKARKQYGDIAVIQAIAACEIEAPVDAASFFVGCLQQGDRNERKQQSGYSVLARAAIEHDERQGNRGHPEAAYRPSRDAEELDDLGGIVH